MDFSIGQRLEHPEHGPATVIYLGENYVGLEFDKGENALLRIDSFESQPQTGLLASMDDALPLPENLPWPMSTFVCEDAEAEHFLGAHWGPFVEDPKEIILRLPEMVQTAKVKNGYGDIVKPARNLPEDWQKGCILAWPSPQRGIAVGLKLTPEANVVAGMYPFITEGSQHLLRLRRVNVWEDGIMAQIAATCGEADLSFFDTDFVANRGWYESGSVQDFILAGIAYGAKPSDVFELPFTPNPEQIEWERVLAERRGEEPPDVPENFNLCGMAMLLPMHDGDIDEYSFRGPVKQVSSFDDFLGQSGWRMRVTVLRLAEGDFDLDIYVTRRAWRGQEPPQEGGDVEGTLWLQGRLWNPRPGR